GTTCDCPNRFSFLRLKQYSSPRTSVRSLGSETGNRSALDGAIQTALDTNTLWQSCKRCLSLLTVCLRLFLMPSFNFGTQSLNEPCQSLFVSGEPIRLRALLDELFVNLSEYFLTL